MKIICVIGTRPEVIKVAPVVVELQKEHEVIVVSTGQHREMVELAAKTFNLKIDVNLDLMQPNQKITDILSLTVHHLSEILINLKPDLVLGQGDTSTALASALASYYNKIPFGHIEAGLRTGNYNNPWPEEMNRVLITKLSTLHFCPTATSKDNLNSEGIFENVSITGNTVIDSLLKFVDNTVIAKNKILLTVHRRENFGQPLIDILDAILELVERNEDLEIKFPVHPNPNVRSLVYQKLNHPRIDLCEPLSYQEFIKAMCEAKIILTDSGGVQEEAPALGKPVLVLRDFTERPEAVDMGVVRLVGSSTKNIILEVEHLLNDTVHYSRMATGGSPYGDGNASSRILNSINQWNTK
jgi:UDP-N-acetylglucosamine 2-epimerase (non-hydrolysing)